jgi:hypothetical protein
MAEVSRDEAVRFLLGDAAEAEREALERRLFEDESLAEQFEIVEDELIDAYVAGRLPPQERSRFEQAYLGSPERAAKVAFARALDQRLGTDQRAAGTDRGRKWLLPLAASLLLGLGGYFGYRFVQAERELSQVQRRQAELKSQLDRALAERSRLERALEATRSEIAELERQAASVIAFTLEPRLLRDSGARHDLLVPAGATVVRLTAPMSQSGYRSFSAALKTPEDRQVWQQQDIQPQPGVKSLTLAVPAAVLPSGDYILSVTGVTASGRNESVADFAFRVTKR